MRSGDFRVGIVQFQWFAQALVRLFSFVRLALCRDDINKVWSLSLLFRLQNVYSQIKQARLKPLSKPISQPAPSPPSSCQPPDTVDYLRFLYVSSSSVKTPLSSQVGNVVLIDVFNVLSRVLSMVLFLRASWCVPAEKKTRSIPPPDTGQPWNCLHILTTPNVRLVDMSVPWQTHIPIVKDDFLTELVIRDVRNWVFFHPLL